MRITRTQARRFGLEPKNPKPTEFEKLVAKEKRERLERLYDADLARRDLTRRVGPVRMVEQYEFYPGRKWKADRAFLGLDRILIEIDGGTYAKGEKRGRHVRGQGYAEDARKQNAAAELGYLYLRFDAKMVRSGEAAETTIRVLIAAREKVRP